MQYLLTQDERDALVPLADMNRAKAALSVALRIIVPEGKCVHDRTPKSIGYCDQCPAAGLHAIGDEYHQYKLLCPKPRRYSK